MARFVTDAYRATRIPLLIVLFGLAIGVASAVVLALFVPSTIALAGLVQLHPNIKLSPDQSRMLQTLTPEQLSFARHVAQLFSIDGYIIAVVLIVWAIMFGRFLARRSVDRRV